eukprot:1160500-Pelagomonas_calceolata.AAC.5
MEKRRCNEALPHAYAPTGASSCKRRCMHVGKGRWGKGMVQGACTCGKGRWKGVMGLIEQGGARRKGVMGLVSKKLGGRAAVKKRGQD